MSNDTTRADIPNQIANVSEDECQIGNSFVPNMDQYTDIGCLVNNTHMVKI